MSETKKKQTAQLLGKTDDGQAAIRVKTKIKTVEDRIVPWEDWQAIVDGPGPPPDPEPYPVPTEAVADYFRRVKNAVAYHVKHYYPKLGDNSGEWALYACLNYDGILCWDRMAEWFKADVDVYKQCVDYATRLWRVGAGPYWAGSGSNGTSGHYNYAQGMAEMDTTEPYRMAAHTCANKSAFSRPEEVHNPKWMGSMTNWPRPRGLSVSSHVAAWTIKPIDPDRDKFIKSSIEDHILGVHFKDWLFVDLEDWDTVVNCGTEYAPFVMALGCRGLIQARNSGVAMVLGGKELVDRIDELLPTLAASLWQVAYRETETHQGMFYRPTVGNDELPAPDLNMLLFPLYAHVAAAKGRREYYEMAEKLLVGSQQAYLEGMKQINQNVLWVDYGLELLGWKPEGIG